MSCGGQRDVGKGMSAVDIANAAGVVPKMMQEYRRRMEQAESAISNDQVVSEIASQGENQPRYAPAQSSTSLRDCHGETSHGEVRPEMSRKKTRDWQSGRFWRDKPVRERISAKDVLTAEGLDVRNIRSLPEIDQPPDCEAMIDGQWCGIEHTELVHERTMKRSIRAQRTGKETPKAYFWTQTSLLAALQKIIDDKDQDAARMKGGPYTRYMLVIETEEHYMLVNEKEMFLNRDAVREFLPDACFRATRITDAFLSLSYEHDADGCGYYPPFRLRLVKT